jgi:glyoxylase-like metal-dependent hydrolase (beta-lactamase superfamily II)
MAIRPVVFDLYLPGGLAGPDPVDLDVRCFLITHGSGIALLDTGLPGSTPAIGNALIELGASWADVTDILLSHDHPDHIGSLSEVTANAPQAIVWGNPPLSANALNDGDVVRGLSVLATPGHTEGHVSLLDGDGALFVGDIVGNQNGRLTRAPAPFTADAAQAERSLHRITQIGFDRLLTAHGPELPDAAEALHVLAHNAPPHTP